MILALNVSFRYQEMTKEVSEKSKTEVKSIQKKKIRFNLAEEEKMVEELERWEKLTVQKKPKVNKESETLSDMSPMKSSSKHFVLPQLKRPPAVETNGSGVMIDKFLKRNGSQRSSIAIPISFEGENLNGMEMPSPIHAKFGIEAISMVDNEGRYGSEIGTEIDHDHDADHGLIKIVGVMQQDEDLDGVKTQIYKMMEGEDDLDFNGENMKQFSLKNISLLCRGINQDMEDKVDTSLNETNLLIKECTDLMKNLQDENDHLRQELIELHQQVFSFGF